MERPQVLDVVYAGAGRRYRIVMAVTDTAGVVVSLPDFHWSAGDFTVVGPPPRRNWLTEHGIADDHAAEVARILALEWPRLTAGELDWRYDRCAHTWAKSRRRKGGLLLVIGETAKGWFQVRVGPESSSYSAICKGGTLIATRKSWDAACEAGSDWDREG